MGKHRMSVAILVQFNLATESGSQVAFGAQGGTVPIDSGATIAHRMWALVGGASKRSHVEKGHG